MPRLGDAFRTLPVNHSAIIATRVSKGALVVGKDADLLLLDPSRSYTLDAAKLFQRHKMSPYVGFEFTGVVSRTMRRGETIFLDGKIVAETKGTFIRPERQP